MQISYLSSIGRKGYNTEEFPLPLVEGMGVSATLITTAFGTNSTSKSALVWKSQDGFVNAKRLQPLFSPVGSI